MSFDPQGALFVRIGTTNTSALRTRWEQILPTLQEAPLLQNRLPEKWGVLVDSQWSLSAGFWSPNLLTPEQNPAILIAPWVFNDKEDASRLVIHELTHLVHHSARPHEASWIREGVAMMSEYVATGSLSSVMQEGFLNPEAPLISELDPREADYSNQGARGAKYGHILQYFYYLYRLCGKNELLEAILTSKLPQNGVSFLDQLLRSRYRAGREDFDPVCRDFATSFRAFSMARFTQDPTSPSGFVTIASDTQATIRKQPSWISPYSSTGYRIKPDAKCLTNDVKLSQTLCLRIRLR